MADRRGDVIMVALPFTDMARSKVRPVLIVQNDVANEVSGNVIVVAISSRVPQRLLPVQYLIPAESQIARAAGLPKTSIVDCGVIFTIAKRRVVRKTGTLPSAAMSAVDSRLRISPGID